MSKAPCLKITRLAQSNSPRGAPRFGVRFGFFFAPDTIPTSSSSSAARAAAFAARLCCTALTTLAAQTPTMAVTTRPIVMYRAVERYAADSS